MVILIKIIVIILLFFPSMGFSGVDLPWSTTFNCSDWLTYSDTLTCDGIVKGGGWTCTTGGTNLYEQIIADANFSRGSGGKGQRHWLGDGENINSGGTEISFNTPQSEVWIRWYMRFQLGFQWSGYQGFKMIYLYAGGSNLNYILIGYNATNISYYTQSGDHTHYSCSNCGFENLWGAVSNGSWHFFEMHIKSETGPGYNNGIYQLWVDGQLVTDVNNVNHGLLSAGKSITGFLIGSNAKYPNNSQCMYVDYDEITVSNTGYIGPLPGSQSISLTGGNQSMSLTGGSQSITLGN